MRIFVPLAVLVVCTVGRADVRNCNCNPAEAERFEARECALCREAEKQPAQPTVFFLKDNNPRKPNRMLALTRQHHDGPEPLPSMTQAQRVEFWSAAIGKAKELWGAKWGVAMNGAESRTQCHAHLHIGKLLDEAETAVFITVNGPADIPSPKEGTGLWIHAEGDKLHVHMGEQITEFVLQR